MSSVGMQLFTLTTEVQWITKLICSERNCKQTKGNALGRVFCVFWFFLNKTYKVGTCYYKWSPRRLQIFYV